MPPGGRVDFGGDGVSSLMRTEGELLSFYRRERWMVPSLLRAWLAAHPEDRRVRITVWRIDEESLGNLGLLKRSGRLDLLEVRTSRRPRKVVPGVDWAQTRSHAKRIDLLDSQRCILPSLNLRKYSATAVETVWAGPERGVETLRRSLGDELRRAGRPIKAICTFGVHPDQLAGLEAGCVILFHLWRQIQRGDGRGKRLEGWPGHVRLVEAASHAKWVAFSDGSAWLTSANLQKNAGEETLVRFAAGSPAAAAIHAVSAAMASHAPRRPAEIERMLRAAKAAHESGLRLR